MHLHRHVLAANKESNLPTLHHLVHQVAEVAAPLQRREDVAHSRTLRELGSLHHIEEAVAIDVLDRRVVDLGEEAARALQHRPHDCAVR